MQSRHVFTIKALTILKYLLFHCWKKVSRRGIRMSDCSKSRGGISIFKRFFLSNVSICQHGRTTEKDNEVSRNLSCDLIIIEIILKRITYLIRRDRIIPLFTSLNIQKKSLCPMLSHSLTKNLFTNFFFFFHQYE